MKRFFWFLIVINLGLLAYFNIGYIMPGEPEIKLAEINPDKIKLLSQGEIDGLPKKQTELPLMSTPSLEPETKATCFEWGTFSDSNLASAQKILTKMSLPTTAKQQEAEGPQRYWVYRPPLKTAADAQKKAAQLKALGVEDLFVVQEEKWKNAISFGIFEDEQLAIKLMQELQAKGVKNIEKTVRSNGKGHHTLVLGKLDEKDMAELNKLKPNFPAAELKAVSCN